MSRKQHTELTHNDRVIFDNHKHLVEVTINKKYKSFLNEFKQQGITEDDLYQFGYIGLIRAILKYDQELGSLDFKYYAIKMIHGYISSMAKQNALYSSSKKEFKKIESVCIYSEQDNDLILLDILEDKNSILPDHSNSNQSLLNEIMNDNEKIHKLLTQVSNGRFHHQAVEIVKMRYQGKKNIEIANELNINVKSINGILNRLKNKCTPEQLIEAALNL